MMQARSRRLRRARIVARDTDAKDEPSPVAWARRRMSAAILSRSSAPPPSMATETLAQALPPAMLRVSARRKSAASAPASKISSGIEPGERDYNERVCRPPRRYRARRRHRRSAAPKRRSARAPGCCRAQVISMTPLPSRARRRAQSRRTPQVGLCRSAGAAPAIRRRSASAPTIRDRRRGAAED